MSAWYRPEKVVVCTRLAGDHQSGLLLYAIVQRYRYAKATLPGTEGTWSANKRSVWYRAAALSDSQGDRALAKLDKRGLVERKHGPWAGNPNVLYVRPTQRTEIGLEISTTFLALDTWLALLAADANNSSSGKGLSSKALLQLWEIWPDKDATKLAAIAEWYERLGGMWGGKNKKELDFRAYAQPLLQRILKSQPAIAVIDIDKPDELIHCKRWCQATRSA